MGVVIVEEKGQLGVNLGRTIITNGIPCVRGGAALFPDDFEEDLFIRPSVMAETHRPARRAAVPCVSAFRPVSAQPTCT